MADQKKERVRQLKRSYMGIWLIIFFLLIILSFSLVVVFIAVFSSSFINGKLDSERKTVQNMSDIYELCVADDTDPASVLSAFGRDYIILDEVGGVKDMSSPEVADFTAEPQGEALEETSMKFAISSYLYDANVYPDAASPVIQDDGEDVDVYLFEIVENLNAYIVPSDRDLFSEELMGPVASHTDIRVFSDLRERMIRIPFWIGVQMSDGQSEFVGRSGITVEVPDLILLLVLLVSILALVLFIYIVMMGNIISSFMRRRKTLRIFFTDAVTQGRNYMYFLYRGEELLGKRSNREIRFFVVNLRFIRYRNFCICHSVTEGERILGLIYQGIQKRLDRRKEIVAHTGNADFALLLRGDEKEAFKTRLQAIIDEVAHVTEDHTFLFQAGVEILEPVVKVKKRKKIDLGEVYNTAVASRESLGGEDAGIAFFTEQLVEDRRWEETVQDHQQAALDKEEFVVYYQPKYDPRTDELCGAEALIRWQSPEFGFVPPGRMIPIFEKNGFITEIDHYMISHVARDQKRWLDAGFRCVPVSVNVSRAHFIESDLAEQIRDLVDAEGTPHELIEVELTESAFFDDKNALIHTIERLQSYGFAVSMDDFGSGYSSLNSLKDLPLDVLKLDAEFFRGENGGERGEIVVSEAIKLAKTLRMRTVAEGVEVREQVEFLASQGCDMIQGYFYAKPMPGSEYEVRMSEHYKPKEEV